MNRRESRAIGSFYARMEPLSASITTPLTHSAVPDRISTGVDGLDGVLNGGLPRDRLYLIEGSPGVGKTTLAMQFLLEGVRSGETGLYITLSETKEELEMVARSHGWDLTPLHLFELAAVEQNYGAKRKALFFIPRTLN